MHDHLDCGRSSLAFSLAQSTRRTIALALSPWLIFASAQVAASDVLILRNGAERQGALQNCSNQACVLDQRAISRDTIEWIGLASLPPAPAVQDPTVDEVHARGGAVTPGKLVQIDARVVTMDGKTFARSEVSWVHLGRAATSTVGVFRGTFNWSIRQQVPSGPQNWDGRADLLLTDDGKGGLTGTLKGTQVQKLELSRCHAETHGTISADLTGTITGQKITVKVLNGRADWPSSTACREGGMAGTGAAVFKWPYLDEPFRGLAPDGAGNFVFDHEWPIPQLYPTTLHYTLKLTRAQ